MVSTSPIEVMSWAKSFIFVQRPMRRHVLERVVRMSLSARCMSAPTTSAFSMARIISSPGLIPSFLPIFFWKDVSMRFDSRRKAFFSLITLMRSVSCHLFFCLIAWYLDSQSSMETVSGLSSSMTSATRSALSLDTWAVPMRVISLPSKVSLCILSLFVMDNGCILHSNKKWPKAQGFRRKASFA